MNTARSRRSRINEAAPAIVRVVQGSLWSATGRRSSSDPSEGPG